jgi:pimeloyl-ACP methyl ester carboxylesterase
MSSSVVFVHGIACWIHPEQRHHTQTGDIWDDLRAAIPRTSVAVDLPGFGGADWIKQTVRDALATNPDGFSRSWDRWGCLSTYARSREVVRLGHGRDVTGPITASRLPTRRCPLSAGGTPARCHDLLPVVT